MATSVFVNLPASDLARSRQFFTALGYTIDEKFSDDNGICVVISDTIYAMLLKPEFFATFTKRPVGDATGATEVIVALGVDDREGVDRLVESALANGGSASNETQDMGWMYSRSFQDPDNHLWEVVWMDPTAAEQGPPAEQEAAVN
jgi:predicted lactoylglutathione lyase